MLEEKKSFNTSKKGLKAGEGRAELFTRVSFPRVFPRVAVYTCWGFGFVSWFCCWQKLFCVLLVFAAMLRNDFVLNVCARGSLWDEAGRP